MSVRAATATLALCCVWLGLSPARADGTAADSPAVSRARVHIAAVEYELAQAALEEALRAGGNAPHVTATLHGLLCVVAASRERAVDARASFERQLAIEPAADVDRELGPKIVDPFMAARSALGARAIVVTARASERGIEVVVTADPLGMIASLRASEHTDNGAMLASVPAPRTAAASPVLLAIPRGAARSVMVSALDVYGNRLADVAVRLHEASVAISNDASRPSRRWMLWAGSSLAFAATGSVFALLARSTRRDLDDVLANSGQHTLDEAEQLARRGSRQTLLANLGFAATGLFAVGAVIDYVWFREPRSVRAHAATSQAGATLGVAGTF